MTDDVRLELERQRTEELLRSSRDSYVPLAVAAATAFHQAHGNTRAIVSRGDYDDALNIAATALSRLIPLFALIDPREGRVALKPDPTRQRFVKGAIALRDSDGSLTGGLSVRRSDLVSALSLVKRAGIVFSLAALPQEPGAEAPEQAFPDPGQKKPATPR